MINISKKIFFIACLFKNINSEKHDRQYFLEKPSRLTPEFLAENIGNPIYCIK